MLKTPVLPKIHRHQVQKPEQNFFRLKEENSRLRTDISRARIDKAQLRKEISQLKTENIQLNAESTQLKNEIFLMQEEIQDQKDISASKDLELAENTAMYQILEEERLRLLFL
ncbi:MAG: hypothetical protein KAI83_14380 [Thiomargarita sp.]|nr:hypothetical protein [Thiomargarita sp.]